MTRPERHTSWDRLEPDQDQPWTRLERVELSPPPRRVVRDTVRTHTGSTTEYTLRPRGHHAVFVLPVTDDAHAVLLRQYRYPLQATITEVVAGGIDDGEDEFTAARRELAEEIGGTARELIALPGFYPQPSFTGVTFRALLALGVQTGQATPEDTELIIPERVPLREAYRRLHAGEILDAGSALTLFHARPVLLARGLLEGNPERNDEG